MQLAELAMWVLNSEITTKILVLLMLLPSWTNRYNIEVVHNMAGIDYVKLTPIKWYPQFLKEVNERVNGTEAVN